MEPELLRAYFWELAGQDGSRFIAVTDPGSKLEKLAKEHGYAAIFLGDPAIGGRYSVLSVFGMVPAALMGIDVDVGDLLQSVLAKQGFDSDAAIVEHAESSGSIPRGTPSCAGRSSG